MNNRAQASLRSLWRGASMEVVAAALATIALQISFALFLVLHGDPVLVQREAQMFRSVLTWVEKTPPPSPRQQTPPFRPPGSARAATGSVERAVPADAQGDESEMSSKPPPPLRLTLPSTTPPGTFDSHALGRSKSPPPYEQTRFAKVWAPDGGAVQKTWAHRSRAAQLLLSATGALDFPCTDEEKRLRKPSCAGAQYDGIE